MLQVGHRKVGRSTTQVLKYPPTQVLKTGSHLRSRGKTLKEAVSLCLLTVVRPLGSLCVLDMGEQIRISVLAESLITMAGLVPGKDIEIKFTGLRPGEKLYEELMTEVEEITRKAHEKVLVAEASYIPPALNEYLDKLEACISSGDGTECLAALHELVPTYKAGNGNGNAVAGAVTSEAASKSQI